MIPDTVTVYRRGLELNNYGLMIAKACDSQSSQLFSLRNYFPFYGTYGEYNERHSIQFFNKIS